ncbi:hypothetical protein KKF34_13930 [Myxococcota bacterium]|nr:hypothetical protein [Myxococcota bacterium]MBU1383091.1 hypothetical protein [Myxococcota bacterium]MBU1497971.1 hypothetical protein [Myxococcota bacterium]
MAKQDPNAWMLTFSDLLNLLITFFVLLIAMSSMDNKKLKDFAGFFAGAVGVLEKNSAGSASPGPEKTTTTRDLSGNKSAANFQLSGSLGGTSRKSSSADEKGNSTTADSKHMAIEGRQTRVVAGHEYGWQQFSRRVQETIHDDQMRHFLTVGTRPDGYEIKLKKINPFVDGKAVMIPEMETVIKRIGQLARICNCNVHIKGGFKKSEDFISGNFYSLYHLGAARAVYVTWVFQQEGSPGFRLYPQVIPEGEGSQIEFFFETSSR